MPRFYVLSGPEIGRTHDAAEGALLGRSPECEVPVRGNSVSRKHAQLERQGDAWVLIDLGSRNGISKDDARSERIELEDGGTFKLGEVELRFRAVGEAAERGAAPKPARAIAPPKPKSPPEAEPTAPSREVEIESFEIELEDEVEIGELEIDFDPEGLAPPKQSAPEPVAEAKAEPKRAKPGRVAERAAAAGIAMPSRGTRGPAGPVELKDAGRPVLQYNRETQRRGFLVADLSQYPAWVKLVVGLLVAALFVGIFFAAFKAASLLKGGGAGQPPLEEEELE